MRSGTGRLAAILFGVSLGAGVARAQFNPVLEWSWTGSSTRPLALNVMSTPSVVDLDGDGTPDVVFGSTNSTDVFLAPGYLRALRGSDGSELFTITQTSPEDLRVSCACSVATGDIDLDGRPEIVTCDATAQRLIAFEHDGTFKWRSGPLGNLWWGAPAIADLDQDGTPEIVMGRQAFDNEGNLLWTGSDTTASQSPVGPLSLVSDVDLDGSPEVVAGRAVYTASGAIDYRNPTLPDGYNAVGNFDDDPEAEIVLVSGGRVWLLEHDMTIKWGPLTIPQGGAGGPPTVADYDFDGEPEIGVAGALRYVAIETDGTLKWQVVTQDRTSNRTGSSVFDFEGDGAAEVVYSDEKNLYIFRGTDGGILFQKPLSSCTWHEYPLVADVDADGAAELLAVANDTCGFGPERGVFVWGPGSEEWVPTRPIWNEHTYHITNVYIDGTVPAVEPNNWQFSRLNNFRLNEFGMFEGPACDVNIDRRVNFVDIFQILIARNQPAIPGDARDFDGDGYVTVNDARNCILRCTRPRCIP